MWPWQMHVAIATRKSGSVHFRILASRSLADKVTDEEENLNHVNILVRRTIS